MDGALKCAATSATAKQRQRLPGSMNLNRPLQSQNLRPRASKVKIYGRATNYFWITPQAMRAPEFPAGSVL